MLYLRCLHDNDTLHRFKITTVPHGMEEKVYSDLLNGIAFEPRKALRAPAPAFALDVEGVARPPRQRRSRRAVGGRGPGQVAPAALLLADGLAPEDDGGADADEEPAPDVIDEFFGCNDLEDALADIFDEFQARPDSGAEADPVDLEGPPPLPPPLSSPTPGTPQVPPVVTPIGGDNGAVTPVAVEGPAAATPVVPEVVLAEAGEREAPAPAPPPPLAPEAPPAEEREGQRRIREGRGQGFGAGKCFSLISKPASSGWQATCPFHAGTPTAPRCRHWIPAKSRSEEDMRAARVLAKAWCLAYSKYDRKHMHLAHRHTGPLPDEQVLDLQSWLVNPPRERAVPDYILDGLTSPPRRRGKAKAIAESSGAAASSSAAPAAPAVDAAEGSGAAASSSAAPAAPAVAADACSSSSSSKKSSKSSSSGPDSDSTSSSS